MKILNPNIGEEIVQIPKYFIYVYATDYGYKYLLKEIKVNLAQHTWYWILMKEEVEIDLEGIGDKYCSFENAINKAINDAYSTVYQFENYDDMMRNWKEIKYINNIKTSYVSKEE